jgi:hypothetical protein
VLILEEVAVGGPVDNHVDDMCKTSKPVENVFGEIHISTGSTWVPHGGHVEKVGKSI